MDTKSGCGWSLFKALAPDSEAASEGGHGGPQWSNSATSEQDMKFERNKDKIPLNTVSGDPIMVSSGVAWQPTGVEQPMFERTEIKVGQIFQETDRHKGRWRVEAFVRVPGLGPHVRLCSLQDRSMKRTLSTVAVADSKRFQEIATPEPAPEPALAKAKAA
jgi:hypothetical protein